MNPSELANWVRDARQRTVELVADLDDEQLMAPYLPIINPLLWEIGHVGWFQEKWVLRRAGRQPILENADALYDSIAIPHEARWKLPLPSRQRTLSYLRDVCDAILETLEGRQPSREEQYYVQLSVFHEDMHDEAFTYTRQTLGFRAPFGGAKQDGPGDGASGDTGHLGDAEVPGGTFPLGATREEPFVFDNEKWAHPVRVEPFRIARAPVTQAEYAAFVDEGGYRRSEFWTDEGWRWRESSGAEHPVYWRQAGDSWQRRHFDRWLPLEPDLPVIHVSWFEADAYCRWAGRRLPTEAEWEAAAAAEPAGDSERSPRKRRFPWGKEPPSPGRANLDWRGMGCVPASALPAGDSPFGCRQMIGNVWEWTASPFLPYPGFTPDPYREYSEPWFGTHRVLRGGCWATRSRLLRNTWRNFYRPERRDVWAGFRTCACQP